MYGFSSIFETVFSPRALYIPCAALTGILNLSKNPTICHNSKFSLKLCAISNAFMLLIPFILDNFSGSNLNTEMVSSPNSFMIL